MSKNNPDHKPRQPIDKPKEAPKKGLSTGAKVGIGLGVAAGVGALAYGAHKIFSGHGNSGHPGAFPKNKFNPIKAKIQIARHHPEAVFNVAKSKVSGLIKGKHGRK